MWFWKRRSFGDDFPEGFRVQRIRIADAIAIAELLPDQIADYVRRNPVVADRLLLESYDNRYSRQLSSRSKVKATLLAGFPPARDTNPSDGSPNWQMQMRPTDYLLFSLGKGRWTAPDSVDSH